MKSLATLMLLIAALCCCSRDDELSLRTSLVPGSENESSVVRFFILNNTGQTLPYTDAILFDFKRPEGDLSLAITGTDGEVRSACNPADHVRPPAIKQLQPGKEIALAEAAEIVSGRYCLEPGQAYNLRVIYTSNVGNGQMVIYSSNDVPFVASR